MIKKILFGLLGFLIILILGFVLFVYSTYDKNYNKEYPVSDIKVEADSALIARGRYLALGPAHCTDCHSPIKDTDISDIANDPPLTGGFGLEIPPGVFYAPNITPDKETGIGRYSDGELYRMLRHNIHPNGRVAIDFMPFINMADQDIRAVIAYLRSRQPVKHLMPESKLTFLGKMVFALGGVKPGVPDEPVLKSIDPDTTAEYGRYLAYAVANCRGCHTERDMKSGKFIGESYAGGMVFGPDALTKGWVYVTPNLTPDKQTGYITDWDEESFVTRMKAGRVYDTSPMPWEAFQHMSDNDLKAIYHFLRSVKPVTRTIVEIAKAPDENS